MRLVDRWEKSLGLGVHHNLRTCVGFEFLCIEVSFLGGREKLVVAMASQA